MMNAHRVLILLASLAALGASACTTSGGVGGSGARPDDEAAEPATDGVRFGLLAENALPVGTCGMVLWTLDGRAPQAIFRYVSGKSGEAVLNGQPVAFDFVTGSGLARYGVSERAAFRPRPGGAYDGATLSVEVTFGLGFDGGHYLERGLLAVQTADGWRTVAPVAGLAGCRA